MLVQEKKEILILFSGALFSMKPIVKEFIKLARTSAAQLYLTLSSDKSLESVTD